MLTPFNSALNSTYVILNNHAYQVLYNLRNNIKYILHTAYYLQGEVFFCFCQVYGELFSFSGIQIFQIVPVIIR